MEWSSAHARIASHGSFFGDPRSKVGLLGRFHAPICVGLRLPRKANRDLPYLFGTKPQDLEQILAPDLSTLPTTLHSSCLGRLASCALEQRQRFSRANFSICQKGKATTRFDAKQEGYLENHPCGFLRCVLARSLSVRLAARSPLDRDSADDTRVALISRIRAALKISKASTLSTSRLVAPGRTSRSPFFAFTARCGVPGMGGQDAPVVAPMKRMAVVGSISATFVNGS